MNRRKSLPVTIFVSLLAALLPGCDGAFSPPAARLQSAAVQSFELRHQVDPVRGRVWSLSREGVLVHEAGRAERTPVSLPGWHWAHEPFACVPHLALGPRGEAIITSNVSPTLWRIDPETLAVSVHEPELSTDQDKDIGFSALVWSTPQNAFFGVSEGHGSLWRIDGALTRADKLSSIPVGAAQCDEGRWAVDSALLQLGDLR